MDVCYIGVVPTMVHMGINHHFSCPPAFALGEPQALCQDHDTDCGPAGVFKQHR